MVIERVGVHAADQADIVRGSAEVRQKIGQLHSTLAVRSEFAVAAQQHRRLFLNECEPDALRHRLRQLLSVEFIQLRLRVEQVDMARRPFRQEKDAVFCLRSKMRRLWSEGIGQRVCRRISREQPVLLQQRG